MAKFKKGQSGNPSGRPKETLEFSLLARLHCQKALDVLVQSLNSKNEKYRIMAANSLLDRGYGKPYAEDKTKIDVDIKLNITFQQAQENGSQLDILPKADSRLSNFTAN